MMRNSHPDGSSIFGSPVYILDTIDFWLYAIKSIHQKWRFISITAEIVANTNPPEISVLSTYCLNGPVYIFDFLSIGQSEAKKMIKNLIENKEIFKVVFNLEEIGEWLWKGTNSKLIYTIDSLIAYNVSLSLQDSHKIHISNFCSWIGKVNIPFMQEITLESVDPDYWKRRPLIYIMQCYLSGTVSVLMKAWLDIRVGLSDDQVHSVFNLSKETIARICGENLTLVPQTSEKKIFVGWKLTKFCIDKLSVNQAFDRVVNSNIC